MGDCKALTDLFRKYTHFIACDVIHLGCHRDLWYKAHCPMPGVVVFFNILSMIFKNSIYVYDLRLIKLRHQVRVPFFFLDKLDIKLHAKITFLNSSKCLGAPAF